MADRKPALVTPFWVRIATETSLSPGWLLIGIPAVVYPSYLALEALFGRGLAAATDFAGDYEAYVAPVLITLFGYVLMMITYVARGTFTDIEALRPVLQGGTDTHARLRRQLSEFERHRLWIGGLVGFLFGLMIQEIAVGRWTRVLAGQWSLRDAVFAVIVFFAWTTVGVGAVYLIDTSRLYSRVGEQHVEIDLLNPAAVSPLTRHGLRIVLSFVILAAAWLIAVPVAAPPVPGSPIGLAILIALSIVPVATAAFVLPVRGLRRHIRARKSEKLDQLRDEIRHTEELMTGSGSRSSEAGAKLPGLLAFEKRIESVREWPFDAPTLTRFFLYVAIPLGSWVGGALVERLLGAALD